MTSSSGRKVRAMERLRCSVNEVMFWPKTISSGEGAFKKSAMA